MGDKIKEVEEEWQKKENEFKEWTAKAKEAHEQGTLKDFLKEWKGKGKGEKKEETQEDEKPEKKQTFLQAVKEGKAKEFIEKLMADRKQAIMDKIKEVEEEWQKKENEFKEWTAKAKEAHEQGTLKEFIKEWKGKGKEQKKEETQEDEKPNNRELFLQAVKEGKAKEFVEKLMADRKQAIMDKIKEVEEEWQKKENEFKV